MESAELDFWAGLDDAVCAHGHLTFSGLEIIGVTKASCNYFIYSTVSPELFLVIYIFQTPSNRFSFCGNTSSLANDITYHLFFCKNK